MADKFDEYMSGVQDPAMRGLHRLAEGLPGGYTALSELVKAALAQHANRPEEDRAVEVSVVSEVITALDKLGISGENLWICYKDISNFNAEYFLLRLQNGKIANDLAKLPYARYNKPTTEGNV